MRDHVSRSSRHVTSEVAPDSTRRAPRARAPRPRMSRPCAAAARARGSPAGTAVVMGVAGTRFSGEADMRIASMLRMGRRAVLLFACGGVDPTESVDEDSDGVVGGAVHGCSLPSATKVPVAGASTLREALASAECGTEIVVADGSYAKDMT